MFLQLINRIPFIFTAHRITIKDLPKSDHFKVSSGQPHIIPRLRLVVVVHVAIVEVHVERP